LCFLSFHVHVCVMNSSPTQQKNKIKKSTNCSMTDRLP
jgi:hypothetical protein